MEDGKSYQYLPPTQPPISPAYTAAVAMKRSSQQATGEPTTTTPAATTGKSGSEPPGEGQENQSSEEEEDPDEKLTEREIMELQMAHAESLCLDRYGEIL